MKNITKTAVFLLAASGSLFAGDATAPYQDSRIDARLNLTVKEGTQVLHFVRDNVDPDVVTKTYVLKHADPYELRRYLREIVQTRKVDESDTGIQAVKYNDGTGIIMVSAEDYRFEDSANGQGIDRIIAALDKPKVASVTGQPVYVYHPKYRPAKELRAMVRAAGADVSGDVTENIGGSDRIRCDEELNLMVFKTTQFSRKNIESVLKEYDRPYPEIKAKITVYEIYAENDAKLGLDFQAWKNNDGIDLFNGGGRFMRNYAPDGANPVKNAGWSDTKYFNFNPKWNTKYVDFLTSKGKAKVLHTCELAVRSETTAEIERTSSVFLATTEPIESSEYTESYIYLPDTEFGTNAAGEGTVLNAVTTGGKAISIVPDDPAEPAVTLTILQMAKNMNVASKYVLRVENGHFEVDGRSVGTKVNAGFAEVTVSELGSGTNPKLNTETLEYSSNNVPALKGNKINTTPSNEFGFKMSLTPSVTDKATMLMVNISNSSLIGYKSNGEARIQQGAELSSRFMISNAGTRLVIGGIEKRGIVSVSGGLPILKDLPLLGWIFSTESESTKKSQLLVVAEVVPVRPSDAFAAEIGTIGETLKKAGESNSFGYRQFLLDSNRIK